MARETREFLELWLKQPLVEGAALDTDAQAGGSSDVATTPGGTDDHPSPVQHLSKEVLQRQGRLSD